MTFVTGRTYVDPDGVLSRTTLMHGDVTNQFKFVLKVVKVCERVDSAFR
jgi:hypothetical protein